MPFITRSDIDDIFGAENTTRWSQLDPDLTTADTDRIDDAIEWAEDYAQDRLRGSRYAVPFGSVTSTVTNWLATLAGWWLFEHRRVREGGGDAAADYSKRREIIEGEMDAVLSGAVTLDMPLARGRQTTCPSVPGEGIA